MNLKVRRTKGSWRQRQGEVFRSTGTEKRRNPAEFSKSTQGGAKGDTRDREVRGRKIQD
jgi:hypothetical protein